MRTNLTHATATVTAALLITTAAASSAAAGPDEPAISAAAGSPAATGSGADPNLDRGFVLPTAMTQPGGSMTYNNYELVLHGLTYGITDRVQVSATVVSPIIKDMPFLGNATIKGRVVATDRFHLALQGGLGYGQIFRLGDDDHGAFATAGALASYCLRADCASLLSASATYQLGLDLEDIGRPVHLVIYGISFAQRLGNHVKLLAEVASAASAGPDPFDNLDGLLVSYGVRFHGQKMAADVGFLRPVITDDGDKSPFVLGLPFASFSYRW
jgi:hypothetical protein